MCITLAGCRCCAAGISTRPWVMRYEPRHEISNSVVCATSKGSDQPAHTRSLIRAFASRFYDYKATDQNAFGVSKLKRSLHRLV